MSKIIEKRMRIDEAIKMGYIPKEGDVYINAFGKKCTVYNINFNNPEKLGGINIEYLAEDKKHKSCSSIRQFEKIFKFEVNFVE